MKQLATQDERFNRRQNGDFERPAKVLQQDTSADGGAVQQIGAAVGLGCTRERGNDVASRAGVESRAPFVKPFLDNIPER